MAKKNLTKTGLYSAIDRRLTQPVEGVVQVLRQRYAEAAASVPFSRGTPQAGTDELWAEWYEANHIPPEKQPAMQKAYITLSMVDKLAKEYKMGLDAIHPQHLADGEFPKYNLTTAHIGISQLRRLAQYLDQPNDKNTRSLLERRITNSLQDIEAMGGPAEAQKSPDAGWRIG